MQEDGARHSLVRSKNETSKRLLLIEKPLQTSYKMIACLRAIVTEELRRVITMWFY